MSHKPIIIKNISLSMHNKLCFEHFSTQITPGKKIVIMGRNGAGKSTLLKIMQGIYKPTEGSVTISPDIIFGYVPQTVTEYQQLSGGQRFNKALSRAFSLQPDIVCLDEPTNHLDLKNKRSLVRMLQHYQGTVIIVSHDPEILSLDVDEIWHIENQRISVFTGNYTEYLREHQLRKEAVEHEREQLQKEKRKLRKLVDQENKRRAQSKSANKHDNDRTLLGAMKESGSRSTGKNVKRLTKLQEDVHSHLADAFVHKKIEPKFNLNTHKLSVGKLVVSISHGSCGYSLTEPVIKDINLHVKADEKIAIVGDNGTGKSTLLKAMLHNQDVAVQGEWHMPEIDAIGYLDQHYSTLNPAFTVMEVIQEVAPSWTDYEIRAHLNDFLFSTQEEVANKVAHLSGGEKARLSLAQIAAHNPQLLLLDEVTNNIDLETCEHIIEVLRVYPGALIVVTHDSALLKSLEVSTIYETKNGTLKAIVERDLFF